eukprot:365302-Chlamydomonas_euryale.AAC.8
MPHHTTPHCQAALGELATDNSALKERVAKLQAGEEGARANMRTLQVRGCGRDGVGVGSEAGVSGGGIARRHACIAGARVWEGWGERWQQSWSVRRRGRAPTCARCRCAYVHARVSVRGKRFAANGPQGLLGGQHTYT